jgi:primosomal replication protein N
MVTLCGIIAGQPRFSHMGGAEKYITFPLEVARLSGAVDCLNIVARETELARQSLGERARLRVLGEVRSFNNKRGEGSRLVITILARELYAADDEDEDENHVRLDGALCKAPTLRKTPMGRQICDIMLAVNRKYGRSDYLPCIAWGQCAQQLSARKVGDRVALIGRIQSRKYIKTTDDGLVERTAFEVSVISLDEEDQSPDCG